MKIENISLEQFEAMQEPTAKAEHIKHKKFKGISGAELATALCFNFFWQRIEREEVQYDLNRRKPDMQFKVNYFDGDKEHITTVDINTNWAIPLKDQIYLKIKRRANCDNPQILQYWRI